MLVGRAAELQQLGLAAARARAGRGSLVLVAGEPGTGKSSLVAEAADRAHAAGAAQGWGICPATGAPPYLPWRRALRRAVPTAARLLEHSGGGGDDARFRMFSEIADALADAAPTVLVLDDLQWADAGSLQLLHFLLRGLPAGPVLVLGTFRDGEVRDGHGLLPVLDSLAGAGSVLQLGGLDVDEVQQLATALHATAPAALLHARTGGNPFLVEQLCTVGGGAGPLPVSALAALGQCLVALSPPCRALLDVAAVAGRQLDVPRLAAALGREPASLLPRLDEALDAGILMRVDAGYAFRHDLLREAVLERLTAERTAGLHWHLGELLATSPATVDEAARHLQAGVLAGHVHRAVEVTLLAAAAAVGALAFEQAAAHYAWVAEHRDAEPDLLVRLGEALLNGGQWESASAAFEQAASLARRTGDAEGLARAALGLGAGLGGFEVRLLDRRQITLLEQAAEAMTGTQSGLHAYVLARLSVALAFVDAPARRAQLSRQAVAVAERSGDAAAQAYALATYADVVAGPDHVSERLDLSARIIALAESAGDEVLALLGSRLRVVALLEAGRIPELDREIAAFARRAERYRLPLVRWYVPLFAGMRALMRGDAAAAERLSLEAEAIGAQAGSVNAPILAATLRLAVCRETGAAPELAPDLRSNLDGVIQSEPTMAGPYVAVGGIALLEGDLARAAWSLDALHRLDFASADRDAEWLGTLAGAADLCVALHATDRAERVLELMAPYAGLLVVDGIAAACLCAVDEVLGTLTRVLGRHREARAHLDRAVAVYEAAGMPLALQRVQALLGSPPPVPVPVVEAALRREGALWSVSYAGREVRLPDAKGLQDLAVLLRDPGREVHVAELAGVALLAGPVDDVLDPQARRAYQQRLRELDRAVEDDEPVRRDRAALERDALLQALAEATGIGGRSRTTGSDVERARQAVRSRFRHLLQRLQEVHPELARHLASAVRTGVTCCYAPEHPVRWDIRTAVVRPVLTPPG